MNQVQTNFKNIYDLFAFCCVRLLEACEAETFDISSYDVFRQESYHRIEGCIGQYVIDCEIDGRYEAFLALLHSLFYITTRDITPEEAYEIAVAIDENVEAEEPKPVNRDSQFICYGSLNTHEVDKVRILPVLTDTVFRRCNQEYRALDERGYEALRTAKEVHVSCIDRFFCHYIIMDKGHILDYPIELVRVRMDSLLGEHYLQKNSLVIDIVPFMQVPLGEIENIRYGDREFWIESLRPGQEDVMMERQNALFGHSAPNPADFMIFPEMLFSHNMVENSKRIEPSTEIVVNGSIWENNMNVCVVTAGTEEVLIHYKRNPFVLKEQGKDKILKTYTERLKPLSGPAYPYRVLEIEGFGRIAVCICRDLDSANMNLVWELLRVDLLIVPAYTPSLDLLNSAENLSKQYNMIVVLCNACSAVEGGQVGFVTLPGKNQENGRQPVVKYYCRNEHCSTCETFCRPRRLEIFFEMRAEQNVLTYGFRWMECGMDE